MPAKAGIQHSVLHIAANTFARLDSGLRRNDEKIGREKSQRARGVANRIRLWFVLVHRQREIDTG